VDTISWVDADGTVHPLTDEDGAAPLLGADGRFMPPVGLVMEEVPGQPGARLRHVKTLSREYAQPVMFHAADEDALRDLLRTWLHRLNPDRGDGALRVANSGGGSRELACRYAAGMGLVEDGDTAGPDWQKAMLVFAAADPYWHDVSDVTDEFTIDAEPVTFFPFFPLRLAGSEVFADATVMNGGDVATWPVWEIHGPTVDLRLRNLTTGKSLAITHAHGAGETIEIDTRPGVKTVVMDDGMNLYGMMDAGSSLWPLERGANAIQVEMSGATEDSRVVLRYKRRWLGP
jgi:hypothetical protein